MTARPRISLLAASSSKQRPISAIFLGGPTPSSSSEAIPDLPEPPSPGGSTNSAHSTHSGLPSPPATNSTGSGSSVRHRDRAVSLPPLQPQTHKTTNSTSSNSMNNRLNGNKYDHAIDSRSLHARERGEVGEEDGEIDEDATARVNTIRRGSRGSNDNLVTLQRARTLQQKTQATLSRLDRLTSPSPSHSPLPAQRSPLIRSRSPLPPVTAPNSRLNPNTLTPAGAAVASRKTPDTLSGSETERERHDYSSDEREHSASPPASATPSHMNPTHASGARTIRSVPPSPRQRRISAPPSPGKPLSAFTRFRTTSGSGGREGSASANASPRTPKKRLNAAAVLDHLYISERDRDRERERERDNRDRDREREREREREAREWDVTSAALAAVASARESASVGSSGGGKRTRAALPREFRERDTLNDGRPSSTVPLPRAYPAPDEDVYIARGSPSPKSSASMLSGGGGQNGFGEYRRELRRRSGVVQRRPEDSVRPGPGEFGEGGGEKKESRSLVAQGLRAAGIVKRTDSANSGGGGGSGEGEDVFVTAAADERRRKRASVIVNGSSGAKGKGKARDAEEWQDDADGRERSQSRTGQARPSTEIALSASPTRAKHHLSDYESPSDRDRERSRTRVTFSDRNLLVRPNSSMAVADSMRSPTGTNFSRDRDEIRTPLATWPHKLPFSLDRDRERDRDKMGSRQGMISDRDRHTPTLRRNVSSASNYPPNPSPSPRSHAQSEHARLMTESLIMFESHLGRLPHATSPSGVQDLYRNAQGVVASAEKLNVLLRLGTNRALEEQIDAEVGDVQGGEEVGAEVWRRVGGEFRESLRISDELVRNVTGLLLGVGKVLKEGSDAAGHVRTVSLDLEGRRAGGSSDGRKSDGRRSVASHRSWDDGGEPLRRFASRVEEQIHAGVRPSSVLASLRDRDRDRRTSMEEDEPSPSAASASTRHSQSSSIALASATRHLFSPRERRESQLPPLDATYDTSGETVQAYDPSPTAAVARRSLERQRPLPQLEIPPHPSESSSSATSQKQTSEKMIRRRSNLVPTAFSVRSTAGPPPLLNAVSSTNATATTAVTPHTVSSPHATASPLPTRADSRANRTRSVIFSRSSTYSALSGLQQQHNTNQRKRTISSTSSAAEDNEVTTRSQPNDRRTVSISESERDARRRTVTGRTRASFDVERERPGDGESQSGSSTTRRERRRTLTEMFSP